ncbi:MAG: hypothetical protein L0H96_03390 [Humibacillus sp.]|nr:hypothetical protein [Humibacillus sp.]MDN5775936.1 hypothetical protein [Humibacillus sp.]
MMITNHVQAASLTLAAVTLGGGLLTAAPAQAVSSQGYQGQVVASSGLRVHTMPSLSGRVNTTLRNGQTIPLVCVVHGPTVSGNSLWYLLPAAPGEGGWASARYIRNLGAAPRWCGNGQVFAIRTTAALNVRTGPTSADTLVQTLASGAGVDVTCKLDGQNVGGNALWYQTQGGHWLAARYVQNIGRAPGWCD